MTVKRETGFSPKLIAPCGMNCGICLGYLREKNKCAGCNSRSNKKPNHCRICAIKICDNKPKIASFCFSCSKYPCRRLKKLDERYRTRYGMSMIENLDQIRKTGLNRFMKAENKKRACRYCGGTVCIHNKLCYSCGKVFK